MNSHTMRRRPRLTRNIALLGLVAAVVVAYAGWELLTGSSGPPNPWLGIWVTAIGLVGAGIAGLRRRTIARRDRFQELAAICLVAILAVWFLAVAREHTPPAWVLLTGVVVLLVCVLAVVGSRRQEEVPPRSLGQAVLDVLAGPVLWSGITLLGALISASGIIFHNARRDFAINGIVSMCERFDRPADARSCEAIAREIVGDPE